MSNARELSELAGSYGTGGFVGMKNRIINGGMVIDQRNAGASVATTTTGNAVFTIDRWAYIVSQASKFTVQQNAGSVTPPVGFTNYLGVTSTSAYSVTSTDYFGVYQPIEGFNTADLGWGTANAASVTVSFWVRSSLTGTFGASIRNGDFNRSYPFSYTINAANTWEQKTVTLAGDTTGTWAATNTKSMVVLFGLGYGSTYSNTSGAWVAGNYGSTTGATSVVGTSGATFYITGVQLEKGSTATSFDYRPYGTELALCQRYFEKSYQQTVAVGTANSSGYAASPTGSNTVPVGAIYSQIQFSNVKRAIPAMTIYGYQGGVGKVSNANTGADFGADSGYVNDTSTSGFNARNGAGVTLATALYGIIYHWTASIEL